MHRRDRVRSCRKVQDRLGFLKKKPLVALNEAFTKVNMKKRALFGGKKVILVAPGPQSVKLEVNSADFDIIVVAGDFWKLNRLLVPRVIPRIDVAYSNPSFVARCCWYGWKMPEETVFKTAFEHPRFDELQVPEGFVDYNYSFEEKCNQVGCNLTTGMAAIIDILEEKPALLYLHGFNFYKGENAYCKGYASKFDTKLIETTKGNLAGHNQEMLLNHFLSLDHSNIQMDSVSKALLNLS